MGRASCRLHRLDAATCLCAAAFFDAPNVVIKGERRAPPLPRCSPTPFCESASSPPLESASAAPPLESASAEGGGSSSIVLVLGFNRTLVRHIYIRDPLRSYENHVRLLTRLVLSLRRVRTRLPIHVLVSGERHAEGERILTGLGVIAAGSGSGCRDGPITGSWARLRSSKSSASCSLGGCSFSTPTR
jgi:hypothetical protein